MNFTAAFFKGSYMKQKNLFLRGAMVCLHQLHDTLPFFGPGMDSLCSLVLKNCAEAGLNCLLVEYEAMFPYRGEHSRIACKDAFSRAEIERFKSEASACGIEIIPLVQTLGHVYHILSHKEYASLRESPEHIQQCCPSNPATLVLAKELIDDIMETHPESRYIHLGGDECRLLGVCPRCAEIAASDPAGKYRVYADYYRQLADYCISRGKKVILWHDIAVKVPEVLSEFSDDVIFHFWNYGDHCHGRLEESFALLNSKVPAKRIIGGAGIRGEGGHGSLLLSPSLAFDNIERMNKLMLQHGAWGSIVTDWPDGGTSWMNALPFFAAHGASASSRELGRAWRKKFTFEYFGVDIPDWFDRCDAVYGPIPLADGFQTQLRNYLNRYDFKDIDLDENMERILHCEAAIPRGGGIYWHCHRRLVLREWIRELEELFHHVTKHKEEFISFVLTYKAAELLLSLSLGHIMAYLEKKNELRYGYQLSGSLYQEDLKRAGEEMNSLAAEMRDFYSRFSPSRHVKNYIERLFDPAFKGKQDPYKY